MYYLFCSLDILNAVMFAEVSLFPNNYGYHTMWGILENLLFSKKNKLLSFLLPNQGPFFALYAFISLICKGGHCVYLFVVGGFGDDKLWMSDLNIESVM